MDLTVDRRAFSVVSRTDSAPDREFWFRQPAAARIRAIAIELQRRIVYGIDRTAARLQRVLEAAEHPRR
jgi:hypothetical protein